MINDIFSLLVMLGFGIIVVVGIGISIQLAQQKKRENDESPKE